MSISAVACCSALICLCPSGAASAQPPDIEDEHKDPLDNADSVVSESDISPIELRPPRVVQRVQAVYPQQTSVSTAQVRVELLVTILANGAVGDVEVQSSGGEGFDTAALAAIRQWVFEPAMRGGKPIASQILVPFEFEHQETTPNKDGAEDAQDKLSPAPAQTPNESDTTQPRSSNVQDDTESDEPKVIEVVVHGEPATRTQIRSSSDFKIENDVIEAAPKQEGAEILRAAPGLYIGRSEGLAVAHQYMLRGFDAEHGQDIEFRVGGLPINLPSHIHGQGYADLGFLVAGSVLDFHVREGISDPQQGDFAVAGSIALRLGVEASKRGVALESSYGAFNTWRQTLRWAPKNEPEETVVAVQVLRTDGFGDRRAGQSASALLQHRFGRGALTFRGIGIAHFARANIAGVLRIDDVESDRVCRLCAYDLATARAQNALSARVLLGFFADYRSPDGANGQIGVWTGYDNFRAQRNFTGFTQTSRELERVAGRGDLIEQQNQTRSVGLRSWYRSRSYRPTKRLRGSMELGVDARLDRVEQAQNLLDASVRLQTWDRRVDASIVGGDLGTWFDLEGAWSDRLRAQIGVRADLLVYDVNDRLGNFAPSSRPQDTFISGFRRSASGIAAGPRSSLEARLFRDLSILAAYGEGYRSPQARLLEDGERAPFTKVRSGDFGLRYQLRNLLEVSTSAYFTHLSDDVAFDAEDGAMERIGASQRVGGVFHVVARPWSNVVGSASLTYVHATLREPPPATAEEPQPPFRVGQHLPFVPPLVVRSDLGGTHPIFPTRLGEDFVARWGIGASYLSPRPLPYGRFSAPVALVDVSAGLKYRAISLRFDAFNLLNTNYAAIEYNFVSDWNPNDGVTTRTPMRHIAAGMPRSWMLSLGVEL